MELIENSLPGTPSFGDGGDFGDGDDSGGDDGGDRGDDEDHDDDGWIYMHSASIFAHSYLVKRRSDLRKIKSNIQDILKFRSGVRCRRGPILIAKIFWSLEGSSFRN